MPWGVQNAEAEWPELQLVSVAECVKWIGRARRLMQAQLRPLRCGKATGAGDMIRVDVRVDDVAQPELTPAQQSIVRFRLAGRVNDRRLTCLARGDHVGGAPAPFVENLLEIQQQNSYPSVPPRLATEARVFSQGNRPRADGDERTGGIEPRSSPRAASVDPPRRARARGRWTGQPAAVRVQRLPRPD